MSERADFVSLLTADANVVARAGTRVHWDAAPLEEDTPLLVIEWDDGERARTLTGKAKLQEASVNVYAAADTRLAAVELAKAAGDALDDFVGPHGTTHFFLITLDDVRDEFAPGAGGEKAGAFGVLSTFRVWFQDAG